MLYSLLRRPNDRSRPISSTAACRALHVRRAEAASWCASACPRACIASAYMWCESHFAPKMPDKSCRATSLVRKASYPRSQARLQSPLAGGHVSEESPSPSSPASCALDDPGSPPAAYGPALATTAAANEPDGYGSGVPNGGET